MKYSFNKEYISDVKIHMAEKLLNLYAQLNMSYSQSFITFTRKLYVRS